MVKWYNLATFDLVGDLAFGESFGGLDNSEYHHCVSTVFQFIKGATYLRVKDAYPLLFRVFLLFMPKFVMEQRRKQYEHANVTVQKRLNVSANDRGDFMDSMLRHRGEKEGLTDRELLANANILIIAGSETTATLLSGLTYWFLRSPEALTKVAREIRSTMKTEADITFNSVTSQLPYMLACVDEALRMYPPVPVGLQRMTLAPIRISGYEIPARVSAPMSRSKRGG